MKRTYQRVPPRLRTGYAIAAIAPREVIQATYHTVTGHPGRYARTWTEYKSVRGMSRWHDIVDWVGGYPFEVAKPDEIFDFYRRCGFRLLRMTTMASGCNEFVFERAP